MSSGSDEKLVSVGYLISSTVGVGSVGVVVGSVVCLSDSKSKTLPSVDVNIIFPFSTFESRLFSKSSTKTELSDMKKNMHQSSMKIVYYLTNKKMNKKLFKGNNEISNYSELHYIKEEQCLLLYKINSKIL